MSESPLEFLCTLDDLQDTGACGIERPDAPPRKALLEAPPGTFDGPPQRVVVVRYDEDIRAFVNSCPHMGLPLEIFPNRFLSEDGTQLVCSTHGARFNVSDGVCTQGPCRGDELRQLTLAISGAKIFFDPGQFDE